MSAGSARLLVWAHSGAPETAAVYSRWSGVRPHPGGAEPVRGAAESAGPTSRCFQTSRPVARIAAGRTLRVVDAAHFSLLYTLDSWLTKATLESRPASDTRARSRILRLCWDSREDHLTISWPGQDKWLGKNFEIVISGQ